MAAPRPDHRRARTADRGAGATAAYAGASHPGTFTATTAPSGGRVSAYVKGPESVVVLANLARFPDLPADAWESP